MGGSSSRFHKAVLYAGSGLAEIYPVTTAVPKVLLGVYDKPLVYYSLSVLLLAGIRQVAVMTAPEHQSALERLLGDGSQFGIHIEYLGVPHSPGPAQSFVAARDFIGHDNVVLILGDTLIYGDGLQQLLAQATQREGATVFAHPVTSPERHAIVELAADGRPLAIDEGPRPPQSNLAITGIFFCDRDVAEIAARLHASRNEAFTLADIQRDYLARGRLHVTPLGRGFAWLDLSTPAALVAAANFIETIESTHGLKIACLEEIAYRKGFISKEQVSASAAQTNNAYGAYLRRLLLDERP